MAKIGKWIGAGLGFAMGGPIGALLGFFIGSSFDSATTIQVSSQPQSPGNRQTGRADFLYSLVILSTAVMKADGKITRNELHYARQFFRENFGTSGENEAMGIIKEIMDKDIHLDQIALQIRYNMNIHSKTQLLYFLFGVARSDGNVCADELKVLDRISDLLGLDTTTYNSIRSMYYDDLDSAYNVLGIEKTATDEEIKKAYRQMARENHPDKVGYMGEDIRKSAEEKFTAINQAYERIKKQRNIN